MANKLILFSNISTFLLDNNFYERNHIYHDAYNIFDIYYLINILNCRKDIWRYEYKEDTELYSEWIDIYRLAYDNKLNAIKYEKYWADKQYPEVDSLVKYAESLGIKGLDDIAIMLDKGSLYWADGPEYKQWAPSITIYLI